MNMSVGVRKKHYEVVFVFLCLVSFVSATERRIFRSFFQNRLHSQPTNRIPGPEKNYTGIRVSPYSDLMMYDHDQTIAILELDPLNNKIINCELLEVRDVSDKESAFNDLRLVGLRSQMISLQKMLQVINICRKLDLPHTYITQEYINYELQIKEQTEDPQKHESVDFFNSVFKGIVPGTKWCGLGDKAESYHDLGSDKQLDKCCRAHDICPVKIFAYSTKYQIYNDFPATKLHCSCEEEFFKCLKKLNTILSNIVGKVYFNNVTCLEDKGVVRGESRKLVAKQFYF